MKVKEEREKTGSKLDIQKTKIIVSGPITSWQIDGKKMGTVTDYFLRLQNHCRWWLSHEIKRHLLLGQKAMINLDSILKSRDNTLLTSLCSQRYGFSSSHVWMWELDYKESWTLKNWCLRTAVLEKTLDSPLDCKEIKLDNPKGNQPWIFIGKTNAKDEVPIFWPPEVKSRLIGKDPDAGKDWRQEEKGQERMRWLDVATNSMDMSLSKL